MVLYYEIGNDDECEEREYYVGIDDVEQALIKIIAKEKNITEKDAEYFIVNSDLTITEIAEEYEEEIKEFFKDDAMETFNNYQEYRNETWGYYGFKKSDFI